MENNSLHQIQKVMQSNHVIISFSGKFTQGLIEELGEAVKKYLESEEKPKKEIFHIFSIFIEQTQNIKNYCLKQENTEWYEKISNSSIVTIGKTEDSSFIYSGNLIEKKDVDSLVSRLEELKQLSKDDLKKLYKEKLKSSMTFESNGAGLGIIDMARKATVPLEYSVTKIDENFSFFTLKAIVGGN